MSTDLSECQECHKTPENSSSSSSLDDGIIRRGRRHGRTYPTSKRKILVCNSRKAPEFRMPSNEELKRREVAQNAIREAMLDYQVKTLVWLGFKDQKKRMETYNNLVSEMEQDSWMF